MPPVALAFGLGLGPGLEADPGLGVAAVEFLAGLLDLTDTDEVLDADIGAFGYLYGTYSFLFGGGADGVGKNGNGKGSAVA